MVLLSLPPTASGKRGINLFSFIVHYTGRHTADVLINGLLEQVIQFHQGIYILTILIPALEQSKVGIDTGKTLSRQRTILLE